MQHVISWLSRGTEFRAGYHLNAVIYTLVKRARACKGNNKIVCFSRKSKTVDQTLVEEFFQFT